MTSAGYTNRRISQSELARVAARLSDRDRAILGFLSRHRYATTHQIRRRYFEDHATQSAATRATVRVLGRLFADRLITRLDRQVGGRSRGSAAFIWHLDGAGERLTREPDGPRRRYIDPALPYLDHSLQITETVVSLHEHTGPNGVHLTAVEVEVEAWRSFVASSGTVKILKPDLYVRLSTDDYDDHWYLEIDRDTESLPVLLAKSRLYAAYRTTGRAQAEHGVFPRVLWVVPTTRRAARLSAALAAISDQFQRLFVAITPDNLIPALIEPTEHAEHAGGAP